MNDGRFRSAEDYILARKRKDYAKAAGRSLASAYLSIATRWRDYSLRAPSEWKRRHGRRVMRDAARKWRKAMGLLPRAGGCCPHRASNCVTVGSGLLGPGPETVNGFVEAQVT